MFLRDRGEV